MKIESPVLTVHEIAELLRVHPITVYRLVARGELRPFKLGRMLRFDRKEIERWVAAKRRRRRLP
jgi:putative molybdopterin biosynthesis protein